MHLCAIGARIKSARERAGMTQEDLAGVLEMSPTHISVIERGVKSPKLETLVNIANSSVSLLTGPEGGLEEREVEQAREAGLQVCTLGKRILRCETAPLCALSAVMYDAGEF